MLFIIFKIKEYFIKWVEISHEVVFLDIIGPLFSTIGEGLFWLGISITTIKGFYGLGLLFAIILAIIIMMAPLILVSIFINIILMIMEDANFWFYKDMPFIKYISINLKFRYLIKIAGINLLLIIITIIIYNFDLFLVLFILWLLVLILYPMISYLNQLSKNKKKKFKK